MKPFFVRLFFTAIIFLPLHAHAQWAVLDAGNLTQNMLTAARTLEQINNQIEQLHNEAQMLDNERRHLTSLTYNAIPQLRATLATTSRLIDEANGLAFDVAQMDSEFARLYPEKYSTTISSDRMAMDAFERWNHSLQALHSAMQVQAQASKNIASDESLLTELVDTSQSAVGQLQATQATNQLLALQTRQSMQDQQLRITQDRAVAAEQARSVAAIERAREVRRRFLGNTAHYTATPVDF